MPMNNPYASWAGPVDPDSFDERRRRLLEYLSGRGAAGAGFGGLRSMALSGRGRPGMGGLAGLPQLTYNPFFSQIAGRAGENFPELPSGVAQSAAQAVQAGGAPVPGGGIPGGMPTPGMPQQLDAAPGRVSTGEPIPSRQLVGLDPIAPRVQKGLTPDMMDPTLLPRVAGSYYAR